MQKFSMLKKSFELIIQAFGYKINFIKDMTHLSELSYSVQCNKSIAV